MTIDPAPPARLTQIRSHALSVVLVDRGAMPEIVAISDHLDDDFVIEALDRPVPHAGLDTVVPLGIVTEAATGFAGRSGLAGRRADGSAWSPRFDLTDLTVDPTSVRYELHDAVAQLGLTIDLTVDDVLTIALTLHNLGSTPYEVLRLAPSVPAPPAATELMTFSGRWCREFRPDRGSFTGTTLVENHSGRTSHAALPAAFVGETGFDEHRGVVLGVQLAWSGNHTLVAEHLPDGRRHVQLGELLEPGELSIEPGGVHRAPDVLVAWSRDGLTAASRRFHAAIRAGLPTHRPRPVVLNTWEAVYFDHRLETLMRLADAAAEVGVERFVLDDGWFGGRRDDTAGLGDWWVSDTVWPSGLGPIVDHVVGLGMEFGLWIEPEMVNPDSDLHRAHPEWTLATPGYEPPLARHQLVLDLGRSEVRDHLFGCIDTLLTDYDIRSLKWDMNRDIVQGSHAGRAGAHAHVVGTYELIDRVRAAHPTVEIESCASGGGRVDAGILRRTDRVWTSDCNDAIERQLTQRGFSMLFPAEVMGAHVGPERAHTTRRRQSLPFRAATALFGQFGVEWNLLDADDRDRKRLADSVALHRRLRPLLHGGDVVRVEHPDPSALVHGVVAPDRSRAVFAYVQLTTPASTVPSPARLVGLDPSTTYRIEVVPEIGAPPHAGREAPAWYRAGSLNRVGGRQLAEQGVQMPVLYPESAVLLEIEAVS